MATRTEKFGLVKPEWTDPFLGPETTAQNMDTIDAELSKAVANADAAIEGLTAAMEAKADKTDLGDVSTLATSDTSSVVNAVNEVKGSLDENVADINDSITMLNQQINISGTIRGLCSNSQSVNDYNNSDYFGVWVMNSQGSTLEDMPVGRTSMEAVYLEVEGMGMTNKTMTQTQKIKQTLVYTTQNMTYVRYRNGESFSNWFLVDEHVDSQKRPYIDKAVSVVGDKVLAMDTDGKIKETQVYIKSLLKHNLDGSYYLNEDVFKFTDQGWEFQNSGYKRAYSAVSKWNGIDCLISEYSDPATEYEGLLENPINGISAPVIADRNQLEILNVCSGVNRTHEDLPCTRTLYYNKLTPKLSGNAVYSNTEGSTKVYLHLLKDFVNLREVGSKYSVTFGMCYGTYISGSSFGLATMFGTRVMLNHLNMGKNLRMFVKNANANSYIYETPVANYLPIENSVIKSYTLTLEYTSSSSFTVTLTDGKITNTCTLPYNLLNYYNTDGTEDYLTFNCLVAFADVYEEIARKGQQLLGAPERKTYSKNVLHYFPNIGALSLVNNHDVQQWNEAASYAIMQKYYSHEPEFWKLKMTPEHYFTITSDGAITSYSGSYNTTIVIPPQIKGITVKKIENYSIQEPVFNQPIQRLVLPNTVEQAWDLLIDSELLCKEFYCPSSLKRFSLTLNLLQQPSSKEMNKIVLNEGLEELGDDGFVGMKKLKSIVLPRSIKEMHVACFSGSNMDIYYEGTKEEWDLIDKKEGAISDWTGSLYCKYTRQPDGVGDLSSLTTTNKSSLVDAVNELAARLAAIE